MSLTRTGPGPGPGPKSTKAKTKLTLSPTGTDPEDSNSLPQPQSFSWWPCWLLPALPVRLRAVGWLVLQDERAQPAREATGPRMEDPCSAPPSATYTLALPPSPSVLPSSTSVTLATGRRREGKSNGGMGGEVRSWQLIVWPLGESERLRGRERD